MVELVEKSVAVGLVPLTLIATLVLLRLEIPSGMCAKLRTLATSNNNNNNNDILLWTCGPYHRHKSTKSG